MGKLDQAKAATKARRRRATELREKLVRAGGEAPLDFLLAVMRNKKNDMGMRIEAAKAAAPYVHPKLQQVALTGPDGGALQVACTVYVPAKAAQHDG